MNILIVNQPLNNRGDEAAHKALIRTILKRVPDALITVLFWEANQDSIDQFMVRSEKVKYVNVHSFPLSRTVLVTSYKKNFRLLWYMHPAYYHIGKYYHNTDVVVCAPGGICMGGFQNWTHLFFLELARLKKKKLIYYGRSFGPFPEETKDNINFKKKSLQLLRYFSFISIRDKKTEDIARKLSVKYVPTVDTAFLDYPQIRIPDEIDEILKGNGYIVLVPNLLIWHYAYKHLSKEYMLDFYKGLTLLLRKKYSQQKIVLLPQTFNYKSEVANDVNFFYEIQNLIKDENLVVIPDKFSSDIQQVIIRNSQCVIGARYHSVVFAINNSVPFLALSYEHKIIGLLTSLEKTEKMIDISVLKDGKKETIEMLLNQIENKIITLHVDKSLTVNAKNIARSSFDEFLRCITN